MSDPDYFLSAKFEIELGIALADNDGQEPLAVRE
jgi:hypothetical protein